MLSAGINYWDTLNVSAIQLEELDKIRCIGLAQQETVYLASLIKTQQQQQQQIQKSKIATRSFDTNSATSTSDFDQEESRSSGKTRDKKSETTLKTRSNSASSTISSTSFDDADKKSKLSNEQDNSVIQTASELGHDKRTAGKFKGSFLTLKLAPFLFF